MLPNCRKRERKRTGDVPQNATYRCTLCTVGAIIIINFNYRFAQHSTNHKYSYTYPTGCLCQSKKKKSAGGIHELCALTHTHTHTRLALLLLSHLNALCVHVAPNKRTSHTHREGDREGERSEMWQQRRRRPLASLQPPSRTFCLPFALCRFAFNVSIIPMYLALLLSY